MKDKLRTVLWDFVGEQFPEGICERIFLFHKLILSPSIENAGVITELRDHLSDQEIFALAERAEKLVVNNRFPVPDPIRSPYPWPQL